MYLMEKLHLYLDLNGEKNYNFQEYGLTDIDLNQLNIMIGANNSGKSRFIRKILSNINYTFENEKILNFINEKIQDLIKSEKMINVLKNLERIHEGKDLKDDINKILIDEKSINNEKLFSSTLDMLRRLRLFCEQKSENLKSDRDCQFYVNILLELLPEIKEYESSISKFLESHGLKENLNFKKVYLPTLRSLRTIGYLGHNNVLENNVEVIDCNPFLSESTYIQHRDYGFDKDFFKTRTIKDYFNDGTYSKDIEIFTGLSMYERIKEMLLGKRTEREKISEFEEFLSKNFFENKEISITPNSKDSVLHIMVGNDERPIYDLGDGLQTILIITFILFAYEGEKVLIGVEEPEMYLHPSLQRKLLEIMLDERFTSFQYFITTHSNHLLDLTMEYGDKITVHSFDKHDDKFSVTHKTDENMLDVLESIGVRPSSVLLSNCVIFVEGISDIIYLRKYLNIYMKQDGIKEFLEDKHFTFLEYNGSNIVHWSFLNGDIRTESINYNFFVVADNDGKLSKEEIEKLETGEEIEFDQRSKKERLIELIKMGNSHVLQVREIENLLTPEIIRESIFSREKDYRKSDHIKKEDIPNFEQEEYQDKYLGEFIDEKLGSINEGKVCKYKKTSGSGTVYDKLKFSNLTTKNINSLDDMSEEAKKLTEKIYDFIKNKNV